MQLPCSRHYYDGLMQIDSVSSLEAWSYLLYGLPDHLVYAIPRDGIHDWILRWSFSAHFNDHDLFLQMSMVSRTSLGTSSSWSPSVGITSTSESSTSATSRPRHPHVHLLPGPLYSSTMPPPPPLLLSPPLPLSPLPLNPLLFPSPRPLCTFIWDPRLRPPLSLVKIVSEFPCKGVPSGRHGDDALVSVDGIACWN